ncbi:hypothetical protein SHY53_11195, partial [Streptococcus suis]|nr:hypothetical protein [Streptococcus suis]
GYKQTDTYKETCLLCEEEKLGKIGNLQRLQQLEQLQRLQQLEQLERLEATNLDYKAFSNVDGAIFYLDPPYEMTSQHSYIG